MATTNRERVGLALDLLKAGLMPFIAREFIDHYKGKNWTGTGAHPPHPTGAETGIHTDGLCCAAKADVGLVE